MYLPVFINNKTRKLDFPSTNYINCNTRLFFIYKNQRYFFR
jgi:hypothetical protein